MPDIELLDEVETAQALSGHRFGTSETLSKIGETLMGIVDADSSVFVTGLTDTNLNALRTKMQRRSVRIHTRKVTRDGNVGHVIMARTIS